MHFPRPEYHVMSLMDEPTAPSVLKRANAPTPPPLLCYPNDAEKSCDIKGADVKGGVELFDLWVLASAILFRLLSMDQVNPKCSCSPTPPSMDNKLHYMI
jgi:hypothetical protein